MLLSKDLLYPSFFFPNYFLIFYLHFKKNLAGYLKILQNISNAEKEYKLKITTIMFKNISNSWNFWLFNWCQSWPSLIYGFVDLFWLMLINFSSYTVFAFFWELSCISRSSVEQDGVCGNLWFIVPSFWNLLCCSCRFSASANMLQFEVTIDAWCTVIFIVGL